MKAKPCILVPGRGYVLCDSAVATHVTLNFPGPVGLLTLPILGMSFTRAGTNCWSWNLDVDKPTLRPSVLTQGTSFEKQLKYRCHSWVTEGKVQFLDDTTHELRGQTIKLLDIETP